MEGDKVEAAGDLHDEPNTEPFGQESLLCESSGICKLAIAMTVEDARSSMQRRDCRWIEFDEGSRSLMVFEFRLDEP